MLDKPYDHRRFLQNAALFSTGLVTSLTHARLASAGSGKHRMARYDYVVIGAGSAGSVVVDSPSLHSHKTPLAVLCVRF